MNKLINPVVTLETESELTDFLELEKEPKEANKFIGSNQLPLGADFTKSKTKTRVIAFLFD
jgi:hypothetical protein